VTREAHSEIKKKRGRPRRAKPIDADLGGRMRLRRANIYERAVERLRTLIIQGKFAPETVLVESELCNLLGISRTPLREALKLLAAQGLVELRQNRSPRVAPMQQQEVQDLFEAIAGIERLTAELAAERISEDELDRLREMQERMEAHRVAEELDAYFSINQTIHHTIVAAARNATLQQTHQWLLARAERARYLALRSHRRWDESIAEHRAILEALEARDAQAAGQLLGAHVLHTGTEVINGLRVQSEWQPREAAE